MKKIQDEVDRIVGSAAFFFFLKRVGKYLANLLADMLKVF